MVIKNSQRRGRLIGKGGNDWKNPESRRDPNPPRLSQCLTMLGACCKACNKWFYYANNPKQKYCSGVCFQKVRRNK